MPTKLSYIENVIIPQLTKSTAQQTPVTLTLEPGCYFGNKTTVTGYVRSVQMEDGSGRSFNIQLMVEGTSLPQTFYIRAMPPALEVIDLSHLETIRPDTVDYGKRFAERLAIKITDRFHWVRCEVGPTELAGPLCIQVWPTGTVRPTSDCRKELHDYLNGLKEATQVIPTMD